MLSERFFKVYFALFYGKLRILDITFIAALEEIFILLSPTMQVLKILIQISSDPFFA